MGNLLLPTTRLPGLAPLLAGDLWARWADDGAVFAVEDLKRSIRYLRLKPSTSCRLAVFRDPETSTQATPPTGILLYLFPSRARAEEFHAKHAKAKLWDKQPTYGPFIDTRYAVVGMPFPNDREIPALRHVYRHHRLKQMVLPLLPEFTDPSWNILKRSTRLELLRYKTGRRAVFRYTLRGRHAQSGESQEAVLHIKAEARSVYAPARNRCVAQISSHAHGSTRCFSEILGTDPTRFLTFRRWHPGVDLTGRVNSPTLLAHTARVLARLHATPFDSTAPLVASPARQVLQETAALVELLPDQKDRITRISAALLPRLAALDAGASVLLHGDFHPGQVVFHKARPLIIDLDRCGLGHPALDVGSFFAHADELGARSGRLAAFVETYRSQSGYQIDRAEIGAGYCLGLLRRCARPFRELACDWPSQVEGRLEQLERALRECD